jgi:hypothetical protein
MTMDELEQFVGERKVIRHKGQVFVNLRDVDEAERFRAAGATVAGDVIRGRFHAEAHLAPMLDFVGEPDPDDPEAVIDARPRIVLEHFRARDGFAVALLAKSPL